MSNARNSFLYLTTVLIWGSTWLAIEYQLGVVSPEVSVVYRYAGAALLLFVWSLMRGLRLRFPLRSHGWFVLLGLLLFCVNYILAYRAQIYIPSALSAIIYSTVLWMNIANARLFFGTRSGPRVLFGALLGILGLVTLFAPQLAELFRSGDLSSGLLLGTGLALGGAFLSSLGSILSQAAQRAQLPIVQSNAWGMLYGAIFTAVVAAFLGRPFVFDPSPGYVISLAYLTVFGSVIAFGAYLTLIGRIGAHRAGYTTVAFPVIAILLSVLFEGLVLDWTMATGMALVLAGNLLVLRAKGDSNQKSPAPSVTFPCQGIRTSSRGL